MFIALILQLFDQYEICFSPLMQPQPVIEETAVHFKSNLDSYITFIVLKKKKLVLNNVSTQFFFNFQFIYIFLLETMRPLDFELQYRKSLFS
jgi:hypothetical protein